MMQAEYKREDHKSYFVVRDARFDKNTEEIAHDLGMLCENKIKGLLPISIHCFNGSTELYYDISGKQSLRVLYEKRKLKKDELKTLFQGLEQAVTELDGYFLDMERLVIDPDYIYMNVAKQEVNLLYYPFSEEEFEESVFRFSDYILDKICNEDEQTVIYAYNFYRIVKEEKGDLAAALRVLLQEDEKLPKKTGDEEDAFEEEAFYLDDAALRDCVTGTDTDKKAEKHILPTIRVAIFGFFALFGVGVMAFSSWKYGLDFSDLFTKTESIAGLIIVLTAIIGAVVFTAVEYLTFREKQAKEETETLTEKERTDFTKKEREDFQEEDEFCMNEYEDSAKKQDADMFETVLLQENCYTEQRVLKGKVRGKSKQIDLAVFPFIIGKSREQADFIIEDSSISRIHARFTLRDDIVFLTDLNSTNGTMKNGVRLQPNELVALESGDEIRFGKVVFTYY